MASGKMRASYCSQIWGTCLWLRPPSIWMTINPMDYEDPIVQIFAGENIDMDSFMNLMGPSPGSRAKNMGDDPYASASSILLFERRWKPYLDSPLLNVKMKVNWEFWDM